MKIQITNIATRKRTEVELDFGLVLAISIANDFFLTPYIFGTIFFAINRLHIFNGAVFAIRQLILGL